MLGNLAWTNEEINKSVKLKEDKSTKRTWFEIASFVPGRNEAGSTSMYARLPDEQRGQTRFRSTAWMDEEERKLVELK